jgi:hypothetical protein
MSNSPYDGPTQSAPVGGGQYAQGQYGQGQYGQGQYGQGQMGGPGYGYGGGGYGSPWAGRRQQRTSPVETKPFFLTSEFAAYALATIALIVTAAVDDSIDSWKFWILQTALTIGYLFSRGIAKSGTKSRSWDPRDEMMIRAREGMENGDRD